MLRPVAGAFALLITVDAVAHAVMGHDWAVFVFQDFILRVATAWPFLPVDEYLARANATAWFPSKEDRPACMPDTIFPFTPILWDVFVVFRQMPRVVFAHVSCGAVALPLGFVQVAFLPSIPRPIHRTLGWLYATAFTVVAVTGAIMGAVDSAGQMAKWNFFAMACFALVPTWLGVLCAAQGRIAEHRAWMLRSFAVCFSVSVLLRLSFLWIIPVMAGPGALPEEVHAPYMALVFLSWSLPILLADVYLSLEAPASKALMPGCSTTTEKPKAT